MSSLPSREGAPPPHLPRKRLIVLCDGTGQDSLNTDSKSKPTNITRISRALAHYGTHVDEASGVPETVEQVIYYQPGVGTETGQLARGGAYGLGVSANVRAAYAFLAHNYHKGDLIYCFGFSRGAYTARAIAGLVTALGLLTKRGMDRFPEVYNNYYRAGQGDRQKIQPYLRQKLLEAHEVDESARDAVQIVGVFDTVGFHAEGITGQAINYFGGSDEKIEFNNTRISPSVKYGYHALALDEKRRPFEPTLWAKPNNIDLAEGAQSRNQEMQQVWFSGVHSDIGGGLDDPRLSDITLAWMISRCSGPDKLAFADIQDNKDWYLFEPKVPLVDNPVMLDIPWATNQGPNVQAFTTMTAEGLKLIENLGHRARPPPSRKNKAGEETNEEIHRSIRDRDMVHKDGKHYWPCDLLTGTLDNGAYAVKGSNDSLPIHRDAERDLVEDDFHGKIRGSPPPPYPVPSHTGQEKGQREETLALHGSRPTL